MAELEEDTGKLRRHLREVRPTNACAVSGPMDTLEAVTREGQGQYKYGFTSSPCSMKKVEGGEGATPSVVSFHVSPPTAPYTTVHQLAVQGKSSEVGKIQLCSRSPNSRARYWLF